MKEIAEGKNSTCSSTQTCIEHQAIFLLHTRPDVSDRQNKRKHPKKPGQGDVFYLKCLECEQRHELADLEPRWKAKEELTCVVCAGLLKTATISFGQPMPEDKMESATIESEECDLFIVLGSSLVVRPACGLPIIAKQAGAKLIIVNREETPLDGIADLVLHDEIGPLMTKTLTLVV